MLSVRDDGDGAVAILPPAPPPPATAPIPPAPVVPPVAPGEGRNALGETLADAEQAVLSEVAQGRTGADALARHPLPPGTSTAEALRFLSTLPQTSYAPDSSGGVVTGPPVAPVAAVEGRNMLGENLADAEKAILSEVAQGRTGADALARHPLPPGTTLAEALRFLSTLPQTVYQFGQDGGIVVGPPVGESTDLSGVLGADRTLESAYKPPGVVSQWRNLVDVFKLTVPESHHKVRLASKSLLGVFK